MDTVFVAAGLTEGKARRLLQRTRDASLAVMPSICPAPDAKIRLLPEIGGGWWYAALPGRTSLVEEHVDGRVAVLVVGEMPGKANPAKEAARAWKAGGLDAVRALDGCFAAVVVDRKTGTMGLAADCGGRRSLRWVREDKGLYVSTHDIPLLTTGAAAVDIDLASAASIVSFDWSMQGKSLVRGIEVQHPKDEVSWRKGKLTVKTKPALDLLDRIDAANERAKRRQLDAMIERFREIARWSCSSLKDVRVSLTAGLDSRATFALLRSSFEAERIIALTVGEEDSLDVAVARKVAEACGVRHEWAPPRPQSADRFFENAAVLAYCMNGDTDAKRGVGGAFSLSDRTLPAVTGHGAELYRGYDYPPRGLGRGTHAELLDWVTFRWTRRLSTLPWADDAFPAEVRERLSGVFRSFEEFVFEPHDKLDLFYYYERLGRWGAHTAQFRWWDIFPLWIDAGLVKLAFRLPAPVGLHGPIHEESLRRFLPAALEVPVNALPSASGKVRTEEDRYRDLFVDPLGGPIRELLTARGAVGPRLFGERGMRELIDEHMEGRRSQVEVLGALVTMESFRELGVRARALGMAKAPPPRPVIRLEPREKEKAGGLYRSYEVRGVHLEMTTRCNAKCPMCPRNYQGGKTREYLPLSELSLGDIRKILPPDFARQLGWLYMCGNYGDAIVARDTLDVFEYLREANPNMMLHLITNGGARDAGWWRRLAKVVSRVTFSVDGLADTNHLYRRGVDWKKLMASIEAFRGAGGKAWWDFLVFKHNEHQVEEARALAEKLGFAQFNVKRTSRFLQNGRAVSGMPVLDEEGRTEYMLEMPGDEAFRNAEFESYESAAAQGGTYQDYLETTPIDCKVLHNRQIYISGEGHVFPCCWTSKLYNEPGKQGEVWRLIERLPGGLDSLDGKKHPIRGIIDGPFFQSEVPATWPSGAPIRKDAAMCARSCGARDVLKAMLR